VSSTYGADGDAASSASSPKDMALAAAQTVKEEIATFATSAQDKVVEQVEQKKESAAETLTQFASAIRVAGDELAQHDQSVAGRIVKQAADGLEGFTRSMSGKRPEELFDAVRDFGRRNPGAFIAGALLAGLAAGRFLRSSAAPDSSRDSTFSNTGYRPLPSDGAWPQTSSPSPSTYSSREQADLRPDGTSDTDRDLGGGARAPYGSEI